jgi:hypothetical protein
VAVKVAVAVVIKSEKVQPNKRVEKQPAIASGYLAFMEPQTLKQFFATQAASTKQKTSHQSAIGRVRNENSTV